MIDVFDFAWKYLDRPRKDRWAAFADARTQGLDFDADQLLDALGLDVHCFAALFFGLPVDQARAAARAEARRLGLGFSSPAIVAAFAERS